MATSILAQADRLHIGTGIKYAILKGALSNNFGKVFCEEKDILRLFRQPPPDYELLLQSAIADVILELSQKFRKAGVDVVIWASIKRRREVVIGICPK